MNRLKSSPWWGKIWIVAVVVQALLPSLGMTDDLPPLENKSAAAGPDWISMGQPVKASSSVFADVDATRHALNSTLTVSQALPYLGWIELNSHGVSKVYVWLWNQSGWMLTGESLNMDATHRAMDLTMSSNDKTPYVAWTEQNDKDVPQLYLKHRMGNHWIIDGGSLNLDPTHRAVNPSLAVAGSVPYLAWSEANSLWVFQVYVKHLMEDGWQLDEGGSLNISATRDAIEPFLVLQASVPYLTWIELSEQNFYQVYVKRWNGSHWELVGGSLNMEPTNHALNPSMAILGETPYVSWVEINSAGVSQLYVKNWDGNSWVTDGGSLNMDSGHHALSPSMVRQGPTLYIIWSELNADGISQIHVKHWSGKEWESDDQQLNSVPTKNAIAPSLAASDTAVYVSWKEVFPDGLYRIMVKQVKAK